MLETKNFAINIIYFILIRGIERKIIRILARRIIIGWDLFSSMACVAFISRCYLLSAGRIAITIDLELRLILHAIAGGIIDSSDPTSVAKMI